MIELSAEHGPDASGLVIYLDFDGVLHDDAVFWSKQQGIHIRTPGRTLFEWAPILEAMLAPYSAVKIVLSTSWVRVKSFDFSLSKLPPGLQARVIGATYHRRFVRKWEFDNQARGAQILADVQRRRPLDWFAIDNDDEAWPPNYRRHLVKTDDHAGLSDPAAQLEIQARLANFMRAQTSAAP